MCVVALVVTVLCIGAERKFSRNGSVRGSGVGFRTPHKGPESWGLGDDADNPIYIFTESRVGYRMPKGRNGEVRLLPATQGDAARSGVRERSKG